MSSKSEKFINERKEYWERLSVIVEKILKKGYKSLTVKEFQDFPNLYRKTCTDSETAKTLKLSPDTVEYINNLVMHSHNIIYSIPKKTFQRFKVFLLHDFPESFLKNIIPISIVFFLFFGIGILTFSVIYFNPQYAKYVLSEDDIQFIKKAYSEKAIRDMADNIYMAGHYIQNNITLGFASFVLGVTYSIGTLYMIIYNAIVIGGLSGVVVSSGYGLNFFTFVIAHSAFELLGICLAGGAGLALGLPMIIAKDEKRTTVFNKKARELVPVIIVAGIFIFIAAFIEGFISASAIHIVIKIFIAIISLTFIVIYSYRTFIIRLFKKITR